MSDGEFEKESTEKEEEDYQEKETVDESLGTYEEGEMEDIIRGEALITLILVPSLRFCCTSSVLLLVVSLAASVLYYSLVSSTQDSAAVYSAACPAVYPAACPAVYPVVCPAMCPAACPAVCPAVCPVACPAVCPAACPAVCPAAHPATNPVEYQASTKHKVISVTIITISTQSRAVMIVGSVTPPPSPGWNLFNTKLPEVAPQSPANLSNDDRQMLLGLGLPQDKWDNLNTLLALYNGTELYDVFSVQVSKPGMELTRSYVLEQMEFLLKNSAHKSGGCKVIIIYCPSLGPFPFTGILHYYGNCRRNTGDWYFEDGYITFNDVASLYMKYSRGRVLTVVTDCHSSGHWVSECAKFLDEKGVRPCGHSAREIGILLKVYASCKTGHDTAELCYTTRAMKLQDDGYVYHTIKKRLSAQQTTIGADFTKIRCGKGEKEKCSINPDSTWPTAREVISGRIYLLQSQDKTHWKYILLDDDAEKINDFIYMYETHGEDGGKYNDIVAELKNYGTILRSGLGEPSQEVKDWMEKRYGYTNIIASRA